MHSVMPAMICCYKNSIILRQNAYNALYIIPTVMYCFHILIAHPAILMSRLITITQI